jgi:hypothetical protein
LVEIPFDFSELDAVNQRTYLSIEKFSQLTSLEKQEIQETAQAAQGKLERAKKYFTGEVRSPIEREENAQIVKGLDLSAKEIEEEIKHKQKFTKNEVKAFQEFLKNECNQNNTESLGAKYIQSQKNLLEVLSENILALPRDLRQMLASRDLYSDQEIINKILSYYESENGQDLFKIDSLFQITTKYILLKTAYQQLVGAQSLLEGKPGAQQIKKALEKVQAGLDFKRYFKEDGDLKNPSLMKKCLVAEVREGIIFRDKQLEVIEKIDQDPRQWLSLRMGIGKTSYILPIIAKLLAEKDLLPVLTVPSRLFASNRDSFDRTTRQLFDQAGFEFTMPVLEEVSFAYLSEKYLQLVKVRHERGYVITDVDQLANLDATIVSLHEKLDQLDLESHQNPSQEFIFDLLYTRKKLHYLQKMSHLLHGDGEIKSHFFGDEVDDTHHISNFINRAKGETKPPDNLVTGTASCLFEEILKADQEDLGELKKALFENSQAVLKEEQRIQYLKAAAKAMLKSPSFLDRLGKSSQFLKDIDPDEFAEYILGEKNALPNGFPAWDSEDEHGEFKKYIGALKTLIGSNAKTLLSLQGGNDFGFSDFDGALIVPKVLKNETQGMRFGDEFELIFAQYLGFHQFQLCQSANGASQEFFKEKLLKLKGKQPEVFQSFFEQAKNHYKDKELPEGDFLFEYLKEPEAYKMRFKLFELVLEEGSVSRYTEQISFANQDIFHGCSYGGVTGTLDPYTLPYISEEVLFSENLGSTRQVEAETLLRMGLNRKKGLDAKASIYADNLGLQEVAAVIKNPKTKALINNSGVTSEGLDNLEWVRKLRKIEDRTYLFMHPRTRTAYIWEKGAEAPQPFMGGKLGKDACCIFAPSDTRGVDLPIGEGDVHLFLGPATSLQDMMQAIYRARQLGSEQKLKIHVSQSMANNIKKNDDKLGLTVGDVINFIKLRTLESKEPLNLQAQIGKVTGDLKATLMKFLRNPVQQLDDYMFYDQKNFIDFYNFNRLERRIAQAIKKKFVITKEIDFRACYSPTEKGAGVDKVLQAFTDVDKEIQGYIELVQGMLPEEETKLNKNIFFLKKTLEDLKKELKEKQKIFLSHIEKHKMYLPANTVMNTQGNIGAKEQVLEVQKESNLTQEVESTLGEDLEFTQGEPHKYLEVDFLTLGNPNSYNPEAFTGMHSPFKSIMISPEAKFLLDKMPTVQGGGPFYYAVSSQGDPRVVGIISHVDYHESLKKTGQDIFIFTQTKDGFRLMDGPSELALDDALLTELVKAKFMLGCTQFNDKEKGLLKQFVQNLFPSATEELKNWVQRKGTPRLLDFLKSLTQ